MMRIYDEDIEALEEKLLPGFKPGSGGHGERNKKSRWEIRRSLN